MNNRGSAALMLSAVTCTYMYVYGACVGPDERPQTGELLCAPWWGKPNVGVELSISV